ncbi:MAG: hypothetical protein ACR2NT_05065 [Acidimicrobiia bacterium]
MTTKHPPVGRVVVPCIAIDVVDGQIVRRVRGVRKLWCAGTEVAVLTSPLGEEP